MIERAIAQLYELAAAVRPDWDSDSLAGGIAAVSNGGWEWPRILRETVRLMCDEQATPRDLAAAVRDPRAPGGYLAPCAPSAEYVAARDALLGRAS